MRCVSLNVWGGQCWSALKDWLTTINADVFCLQEVIRAPYPAPDWLTYLDPNRRLDQRPNLFDDVSVKLPDYYGVFAPAARGPLQDDNGRNYLTEHGIALWVHRRHAISAVHGGFAFGRFREDGWGEEPVPRALQLVKIWSASLGRDVIIGHFHGLRHPLGKGDVPERKQQTERVAEQLQAFGVQEYPCILSGDFNILPDAPFFQAMAGMQLYDQVTARGGTETRTSLYAKAQRFANYTLTSPEIVIEDLQLPSQPEVSDHRPMTLDFSL